MLNMIAIILLALALIAYCLKTAWDHYLLNKLLMETYETRLSEAEAENTRLQFLLEAKNTSQPSSSQVH